MFGHKKSSGHFITPFRGGAFFAADTNKIEAKILSGDEYDAANFTLLSLVLHEGQTAFDIGANIGAYSVSMGRTVGLAGAVHAFEPVPHVRAKLKANLKLNGLKNVVVNDCALGGEPGVATMNAIRSYHFRGGTSSLTDNENVEEIGREHFEQIEVKILPLDAYVANNRIGDVDVMKIDVEGYEINVLEGATETLKAKRPIIVMEHNQRRLAVLGIGEERFSAIFEGCGYDCFDFRLDSGRIELSPYAFDASSKTTNILCLPRMGD